MIEMARREGVARPQRDRGLWVLAVEQLTDGAPVGQRDRRVRGCHPADLGIEAGDPAAPVGQPRAVRRRSVALAPGPGAWLDHRLPVSPRRSVHDPCADPDQEERPELTPLDVGQVEAERPAGEEPQPDEQDDHAEDQRGVPSVIGRWRAPGRPGVGGGGRPAWRPVGGGSAAGVRRAAASGRDLASGSGIWSGSSLVVGLGASRASSGLHRTQSAHRSRRPA